MVRAALLFGCLLTATLASAWLALALADDPDAEDLLVNGDFEDGTTGWSALGGHLKSVADPFEADHVAALALTSSVAFAVQPVSIVPGGSYQLSGQFVAGGGGVDWVRLSLVVYDADGGQLELSAGQLEIPGNWPSPVYPLTCAAVGGTVRVTVSGAVDSVAYLDDLRLKGSPPAAPCASPTPSPTATVTSTPTATQTATPIATQTATPTATHAASPTATYSATPTATDTATPAEPHTATPTATHTATPTATHTATPAATDAETLTATHTTAATSTATITPTITLTITPTLSPTVPPTPAAPPTPSHGLLVNGGFEVAEEGEPVGWQTYGGVLRQVAEPVRSGGFAGAFYSSSASTKWVYQTVAVSPRAWYELAGYVYQGDVWVEGVLLRVSWYASGDGSGSAVATVDSTVELEEAEAGYRYLTTGPVRAPPGVWSAKARVLMRPRSEVSALIYIDDVSFLPVAAPPAPTPSPTPQPSASPTTTPSPDPQPTAQGTPTAVSSLTPTVEPAPAATVPPTPAAPPTPSHGLLVNGGFEVAEEGEPVGWQTYGGVLRQVAEPVRSGGFAGAFYSSSASTKWVYQTVAVSPRAWYELAGYVYQGDVWVEGVLLRVSWYASGDGSGSAVATVDSTTELEEAEAGYRYLTTGPVRAPPGVWSAKARVLMRPRSEVSALIYIDDVSFLPVAAPPAPLESNAAGSVEGGSTGAARTSRASGSRMSSEVLSGSRGSGASPFTPMPTPVIRRSSLLASQEDPSSPNEMLWWPWALAGGAVAVAAAGWGAYLRGRGRRAGDDRTTQPHSAL